ncbi:MAG TPA: octaprenyl diphosphate synthase [Deltaproteobacteria bacterium]|nr:octaprenyl diphosphate synthase [Deltaproteobacteria bacterium]
MENIAKLIGDDLQRLEESIDKLLTTRVSFIREVVHHIIKSGGKRIRPILVILSAKMSGCADYRHIPYAAIVEFIHTATLLHDDVVDNAKTRRGSPTANTLWGNEPSVLVGDFLFSKSFDLMVSDQNSAVLAVMSRVTTALAEGEIMELLKTSDVETTEDDYYEIIANKTAVLLSAACEVGAILGGVDQDKRKALNRFGYHFGMAFQLTDDVLDYVSKGTTLGKDAGSDLKEGKITLPLIHALKSATPEERTVVTDSINKPRMTQKDYRKILNMIKRRGGIEYTVQASKNHAEQAMSFLNAFPPSPYRDAMTGLAQYVTKRET